MKVIPQTILHIRVSVSDCFVGVGTFGIERLGGADLVVHRVIKDLPSITIAAVSDINDAEVDGELIAAGDGVDQIGLIAFAINPKTIGNCVSIDDVEIALVAGRNIIISSADIVVGIIIAIKIAVIGRGCIGRPAKARIHPERMDAGDIENAGVSIL